MKRNGSCCQQNKNTPAEIAQGVRAILRRLRGKTPDVRITIYRPEHANGTAAVICPGGGYGGLVTSAEGSGIARWLNAHGITGVVLEYRLPHGWPLVPLLDAQRAIRLVRSRSKELGCNPHRIGIIGFSAGGHLAATAATPFGAGKASATDPVERTGCRPDFAVLVYPVIGEHRLPKPRLLCGPRVHAEALRVANKGLFQLCAAIGPCWSCDSALFGFGPMLQMTQRTGESLGLEWYCMSVLAQIGRSSGTQSW